jgi:protein-disulfide isomerase
VLENNPETVKIAFKHLPLRMHKMAKPAALAAIAAQEQGKFWQMHDALFATPKLTQEGIDKAAKEIGLDMEKFKKGVKNPLTMQKLNKDMVDAQKAEVNGTPTLFINGRRVQSRDPGAIQKMIDDELAKIKKTDSN